MHDMDAHFKIKMNRTHGVWFINKDNTFDSSRYFHRIIACVEATFMTNCGAVWKRVKGGSAMVMMGYRLVTIKPIQYCAENETKLRVHI